MKKLLFMMVFSLTILYGCGGENTEISDNLDDVYALLNEDKPDSAYAVLMGLDKAVQKMTEAERMRYEVCRVSAMNKMFVSLKNEEEAMKRAVEYYEKHGSPDEKMDACLLLGSVYRDMGDAPLALEWFDKAIIHGEKGTDKTQLAKIHGQKADLFHKQMLLKKGLHELDYMKQIAEKEGDIDMVLNVYSNQTSIYYTMKNYDSVIVIDEKSSELMKSVAKDTSRAVLEQGTTLASYVNMKNFEKARPLMNLFKSKSGRFDKYGNIKSGYEDVCSVFGDFHLGTACLDSAEIYYRYTLLSDRWANKSLGYYGLMRTFEKMGKSDSVVKYSILTCEAYNKLFEELQTNTLQQIEATYNYGRYKQESSEKALEAERARNAAIVMTYIVLIIVAVSLFAWIIWRQKKKQEMEHVLVRLEKAKTDAYRISVERNELKVQLEEKVAMIEELRKRAATATESNACIMVLQKLQSEVEQLNEDLAITESNYSKMMNESENILTTLLLKANSGINVKENEWIRLEEYTKTVYPLFFNNLLSAIPNINQDYVRIATLVKLDFSTTHIASLVCRSVTAVSNARRRMYEKAHKGAVGTADLANEWIKEL